MKTRMLLMVGFWSAILLASGLTGCGGGGSGSSSSSGEDFTSPTVRSTTPLHDSTDVETNRAVSVTFSEDMDATTITADSFYLVPDPPKATISYDQSSRTALLAGGLDSNTTYTATVTDDVTDRAGNYLAESYTWKFTTGTSSDDTSPTVSTTFPASGATGVSTNTSISATFSEPIDPATINPQTFILEKDGVTVAGTLAINGTTASLDPGNSLLEGSTYTATLTTGIKDLAGNSLGTDYSWNFVTTSVQVPQPPDEPVEDTTPPTVLSVSPANGAVDVALNAPIVINYNEPIKPFDYGLIDDRPVTVTFSSDYKTATLQPTVAFTPGVTYTASIRSQDQAGNRMPEPYVWEFSTIPQ